MKKIVYVKNTNAIFLATVLVAGIIALSSPSFMTGAQAEPYYGMNSYETSYGKDNYKSKDTVIVKKINCNNVNVNVNGLELDVLPPALANLLQGYEGERGASSFGSNDGGYGSSGYDKDFKFVCINNNNNTVVVVNEPPSEEPTTGTLLVTKTITCEEVITGVSIQQAVTPCQVFEELFPESSFIIRVEGNNPVPSQFPGSPEGTVVTLGPGNYRVTEEIPFFDPIFEQFPNVVGIITSPTFSGDCTPAMGGATGAIEAGESQTCNIENDVIISSGPLPEP